MELWLLNALKEKIIIKIWPKTGHLPKLRKFCYKIEVSDRTSKSLSQQNLRCPSPLVQFSLPVVSFQLRMQSGGFFMGAVRHRRAHPPLMHSLERSVRKQWEKVMGENYGIKQCEKTIDKGNGRNQWEKARAWTLTCWWHRNWPLSQCRVKLA